MTWTRHERRAFAAGMRSGFRSVLALGLDGGEPPRVFHRDLGSPATDRLARYRDIDAFGADVPDEPWMDDHGRAGVGIEERQQAARAPGARRATAHRQMS